MPSFSLAKRLFTITTPSVGEDLVSSRSPPKLNCHERAGAHKRLPYGISGNHRETCGERGGGHKTLPYGKWCGSGANFVLAELTA